MSRAKNQPVQPTKQAVVQPASWKDRIPAQDYEQLKQTFEIFDQDGSGSIDPAQINKALSELDIEKRNPFIFSLINALKDKNKPIQFPEFLDIICSRVGETKTKDGIKRIFAIYDKDQNGIIDFQEFRLIAKQIHENLTDDDIREMIHSASINNQTPSNEEIAFEDFYKIVAKFNNK